MLHDLNASVKTPAVDRTENTEILEETELEEEKHASLLAGARAASERTGDKLDPILGRPVDAPREPTGHFTPDAPVPRVGTRDGINRCTLGCVYFVGGVASTQ